jgi:hypothetical protein
MTIKRALQIVESWNGLTYDNIVIGTKENYKQALNFLLSKHKVLIMDNVYYLTKSGVKLI